MRAKAILYLSPLAQFDPLHAPRYRKSRQRAVKNLDLEVKTLSKETTGKYPAARCLTIRSLPDEWSLAATLGLWATTQCLTK